MGLHPVSKKTKQKRIYIEKLHWSEHDEITGKVHVAISHTVSRLNPIFQQTRNEDTSVTVTARKSVFHRFKKKQKLYSVYVCARVRVFEWESLEHFLFLFAVCLLLLICAEEGYCVLKKVIMSKLPTFAFVLIPVRPVYLVRHSCADGGFIARPSF